MYPRVRVRAPEDQVSRQGEAASYLLRVIESVSLEGHEPKKTSAVDKGSRGNINPNKLYAAIASTNSKDSLSVPKGKSIKGVDEDNRNNIQASSVPRPRAVLSSPDNDGIIGNRNKRTQEKRRQAKRQASDSNGMTDRHSSLTRERKVPSTQSLYMRIQANSDHRDQRAERQPFSLNNHHPPEPDDGDVKVEKQPLKICMHTPPKANHSDVRIESSSDKRFVSREAGAYPKIKCSELLTSKPRMLIQRVEK